MAVAIAIIYTVYHFVSLVKYKKPSGSNATRCFVSVAKMGCLPSPNGHFALLAVRIKFRAIGAPETLSTPSTGQGRLKEMDVYAFHTQGWVMKAALMTSPLCMAHQSAPYNSDRAKQMLAFNCTTSNEEMWVFIKRTCHCCYCI